MNGIVTSRFLRRRFWIATLMLLVTLVSTAGIVVLLHGAQARNGNYIIAFHHLSDAATRLELELARLSMLADGEAADRSGARAAFVYLLTEFRAISVSNRDEHLNSRAEAVDAGNDSRLTGLDIEFGIDAAAAAARRNLGAASMPEVLRQVWESEDAGSRPDALGGPQVETTLALETAIAHMLRLSAPLVREDGVFTGAERRQIREIERVFSSQIPPMLSRITKILDGEVNRAAERAAIVFVLALAGLCAGAALLNFIAIFRPMERAVLDSQAELIAERDKAVAAHLAKRNFLSVVSHELRTPMNGVLGFASLLAASDLKPEHRKQVEVIQSSGKTLLALVNDILDFSKLEAGTLELADENFSIEEVVSGVATLLRGAAAVKHLKLNVFFDAALPENSRGDGNRLRQILTNLVGNAIKFTESGNIGIEVRKVSNTRVPGSGAELQLAVIDTGIGIPPDKTEMIFERFTQIDSTARRKFEGTGLGLAICKHLVEEMGGRIWVESTPEVGSTFFVRIALAEPEAPAAKSGWLTKATADGAAGSGVGLGQEMGAALAARTAAE